VHAVIVSPLIRALVLGLFDDQFDHATRHAMVCLLLQTLRQTPSLPTHLPMPSSDGMRKAITLLLETNRWQISMYDIASMASMSERTFTRHSRLKWV
jgi:transcriptional regulator GlxA family with amidase domain